MDQSESLWFFMHQESAKLLQQTMQHIGLTFISLFITVLIGLPLGIYITRNKKAAGLVLGFAGVLQTIPSIALLGFLIPVMGIGPIPAITALFLYALLPVIRNTYTGIDGVDPGVKEAALAMGMTGMQRLLKVDLVLAFPVIMAGIRTATVINVGVGTLAAYIAAGGLGEFIFGGIALNNTNMILAGAIPAALLAILLDFLLSLVQRTGRRTRRVTLVLMPLFLLLFSSFYVLPLGYSSRLLAGFTPEFMGRKDGDIGLRAVYGLDIRTVVISDAVMYKAIFNKKLDVISGYSTDGRLKAYDLAVLDDGTKICFEALINDQIDMYPEYTGTALLAILQASAAEVGRLKGNKDSVYNYVRRRFGQKYRLSWLDPIGFNNAYALMMRRGQARQLRIQTISDLTTYLKKDKS